MYNLLVLDHRVRAWLRGSGGSARPLVEAIGTNKRRLAGTDLYVTDGPL